MASFFNAMSANSNPYANNFKDAFGGGGSAGGPPPTNGNPFAFGAVKAVGGGHNTSTSSGPITPTPRPAPSEAAKMAAAAVAAKKTPVSPALAPADSNNNKPSFSTSAFSAFGNMLSTTISGGNSTNTASATNNSNNTSGVFGGASSSFTRVESNTSFSSTTNVFGGGGGNNTSSRSAFGATAASSSTTNVFGKTSGASTAIANASTTANPFGAPSSKPSRVAVGGNTSTGGPAFGGVSSSSAASSNPFGGVGSSSSSANPFGAAKTVANGLSSASNTSASKNPFGSSTGGSNGAAMRNSDSSSSKKQPQQQSNTGKVQRYGGGGDGDSGNANNADDNNDDDGGSNNDGSYYSGEEENDYYSGEEGDDEDGDGYDDHDGNDDGSNGGDDEDDNDPNFEGEDYGADEEDDEEAADDSNQDDDGEISQQQPFSNADDENEGGNDGRGEDDDGSDYGDDNGSNNDEEDDGRHYDEDQDDGDGQFDGDALDDEDADRNDDGDDNDEDANNDSSSAFSPRKPDVFPMSAFGGGGDAPKPAASVFGAATTSSSPSAQKNPFASATGTANVFGSATNTSNSSTANVFGGSGSITPSAAALSSTNPFAKSSSFSAAVPSTASPFGATASSANPFAAGAASDAASSTANPFSGVAKTAASASSVANPFGAPSNPPIAAKPPVSRNLDLLDQPLSALAATPMPAATTAANPFGGAQKRDRNDLGMPPSSNSMSNPFGGMSGGGAPSRTMPPPPLQQQQQQKARVHPPPSMSNGPMSEFAKAFEAFLYAIIDRDPFSAAEALEDVCFAPTCAISSADALNAETKAIADMYKGFEGRFKAHELPADTSRWIPIFALCADCNRLEDALLRAPAGSSGWYSFLVGACERMSAVGEAFEEYAGTALHAGEGPVGFSGSLPLSTIPILIRRNRTIFDRAAAIGDVAVVNTFASVCTKICQEKQHLGYICRNVSGVKDMPINSPAFIKFEAYAYVLIEMIYLDKYSPAKNSIAELFINTFDEVHRSAYHLRVMLHFRFGQYFLQRSEYERAIESLVTALVLCPAVSGSVVRGIPTASSSAGAPNETTAAHNTRRLIALTLIAAMLATGKVPSQSLREEFPFPPYDGLYAALEGGSEEVYSSTMRMYLPTYIDYNVATAIYSMRGVVRAAKLFKARKQLIAEEKKMTAGDAAAALLYPDVVQLAKGCGEEDTLTEEELQLAEDAEAACEERSGWDLTATEVVPLFLTRRLVGRTDGYNMSLAPTAFPQYRQEDN